MLRRGGAARNKSIRRLAPHCTTLKRAQFSRARTAASNTSHHFKNTFSTVPLNGPKGHKMRSNNKIVRLYTEKHLENMRSMFSTLYTDELLSDVTLCCRNGTLKAHKVVLAAISPYFRKVFVETCRQNAVFIMHGVDFPQLKSLIELIYVGCIDLPSDEYRLVCDLADSLEVKGVLIDDVEADESEAASPCGRDTRFRGQKRVAVDYEQQESTKFIRTDDKGALRQYLTV